MTIAHPEQASFQNAFCVGPEQHQSPSNMSEQHQQPPSRTHSQQQQQQPTDSQAGMRGNNQATNQHGGSLLSCDRIIFGILQQCRFDEDEAITSAIIDKITYAAYQACIQHGQFELLGKYSAMLNEVKLRALALLNLMAAWWVLRERIVKIISKTSALVDDDVMQNGMKDAVAQIKGWRSNMAANGTMGSG
jgi:hypothetical protein